MSIKYYNDNAQEYYDKSVSLNLSNIYPYFLKHLNKNDKILDVGCGSGRDSKVFLSLGYDVTSIDGSYELAKLASEYIGKEVIVSDFKDIVYNDEFNGIWAMSSLLHLPKKETLMVYKNLINALKENGVMYVCYKIGNNERYDKGRFFNDYTEKEFRDFILNENLNLKINDIFITGSQMNKEEQFLNAILIKK